MTIDKLLEYLDLEEPSQFEYFENLADLVEADVEIPPETLYELFSEVDMMNLAELASNYFDEVLEHMPEDAVEMYTLLETVRRAFVGMISHIEEDRDVILLSDEFWRFRNWFSLDSRVVVQEIDNEEHEKELPIRDAITLSRFEKLGGEKFEYDFVQALDFEMDEYSMSFADLDYEDKPDPEEGEDREEDPLN